MAMARSRKGPLTIDQWPLHTAAGRNGAPHELTSPYRRGSNHARPAKLENEQKQKRNTRQYLVSRRRGRASRILTKKARKICLPQCHHRRPSFRHLASSPHPFFYFWLEENEYDAIPICEQKIQSKVESGCLISARTDFRIVKLQVHFLGWTIENSISRPVSCPRHGTSKAKAFLSSEQPAANSITIPS